MHTTCISKNKMHNQTNLQEYKIYVLGRFVEFPKYNYEREITQLC